MSTQSAYNALNRLGTLKTAPNGANLHIPTDGMMYPSVMNAKCNEIESLALSCGTHLRATGGTSTDTEVVINLVPKR